MDEKKYLSTDGLIRPVANLINKFALKSHNHTVSEIADYAVDEELLSNSTNIDSIFNSI